MTVQQWSTLAASNNSAPPTGAPEGQSPGSLNNVLREMMASIATEAQVNRVKVLNSVAGTNTITGSMTPALAAYSAGMMVILTPANSNTGATTLNINSLGALDVLNSKGQALSGGELVSGIPSLLVLDSGADDFVLVGPVPTTGSYSEELSGSFAANPTGTVKYSIANGLCTLTCPAGITGTSNGAAPITLLNVPAICTPASTVYARTYAEDGGVTVGAVFLAASKQIYLEPIFSNFSATGTKGLQAGWTSTYPLS